MLNTTMRARFEALRSLAGTTPISNAYLAIGTPLTQPGRIIKISNETDINVLISADGVTDMDFIPANGFVLYDLGSNKAEQAPTLQFATGTTFFAKRAGAADSTSGAIYLTVIYAGV